MSKVFINEETLSAIGAAIREKTGNVALIAPGNMPAEIRGIETGSGGDNIEVDPIVLDSYCSYACAGPIASAYIDKFGDSISTKNVRSASGMFYGYQNEYIPFSIYCSNDGITMDYMFENAYNLVALPDMINVIPEGSLGAMFENCWRLKEIPGEYFDSWDFKNADSNTDCYALFSNCHSLKEFNPGCLIGMVDKVASNNPSQFYFRLGFTNCYVLEELRDLPIPSDVTWTTNAFRETFDNTNRLKFITFFDVGEGVRWKNQTIDLSKYVGYCPDYATNHILGYNSGLTADGEMKDSDSYNALKDEWGEQWASSPEFSRFDRDSAIELIRSLPDTSEYLASAGGTNTIKFLGNSGFGTDATGPESMDEEVIAEAAAKGWTITLVY